jgi:hypothetical protein
VQWEHIFPYNLFGKLSPTPYPDGQSLALAGAKLVKTTFGLRISEIASTGGSYPCLI